MSKAKVCDRCGRVYSQRGENTFDDDGFVYSKWPMKIKHGYGYGKGTNYTSKDFCPDCAEDFMDFMKNRKNNTDHNEEEN